MSPVDVLRAASVGKKEGDVLRVLTIAVGGGGGVGVVGFVRL